MSNPRRWLKPLQTQATLPDDCSFGPLHRGGNRGMKSFSYFHRQLDMSKGLNPWPPQTPPHLIMVKGFMTHFLQ